MLVRELTFFQLEILKELKFKPKYGLELINNLNVSSGRLYPNLKRLENLGLIKGVKKDNRIYYSLSEKGIQEFENIMYWVTDYVLSIGVNLFDEYLSFIVESLRLKEGDRVLIGLKEIKHPFLIRAAREITGRISKRVTLSGSVFVLQKIDLPYVTHIEDLDLLPDKAVDKSCILAMEMNKKNMKNYERVTKSEISIIGKAHSNIFIEKCFYNTLKKMGAEAPFILREGLKKEDVFKKLKELGYEKIRYTSKEEVFVATVILQ